MTTIKHSPEIDSLELYSQGKVRDTYLPYKNEGYILQVATNRLSTHNIVHKSLIPFKAEVLTAMTIFWVEEIFKKWNIAHHVIACGKDIYKYIPIGNYPDDLHLRALIVKKLDMIPIEFIWRHYLTGSLYKKYYAKDIENPYGIMLPRGLKNMSFLKDPAFTPTDKSETDDPLNSVDTAMNYSNEYWLTKKVYRLCRKFALSRGIDIVDTKLECSNNIIADEIITPDSSRFVFNEDINEDGNPKWLDKEIFRQYAEKDWGVNKKVPIKFPEDVIEEGSQRYLQLFRILTGMTLKEFQSSHMG